MAEAAPTAQFLLASASPRRAEYLRQAGFRFAVVAADVEEIPAADEAPLAYALRVAHAKADAVARLHPEATVLAADTDVVLDGRILGKPRDAAEATAMLQALSGRGHTVISAVVLAGGAERSAVSRCTEVQFAPLSAALIARYVASGEPMGKAGAYAIQGGAACFVSSVHGSYTGVVGLPLAETMALLAERGIHPLDPAG